MNAIDVIAAKRDARELTEEEIRWFIDAYTNGKVHDEQAAALLMAIVLRGMGPTETAIWTDAMIASGERLDLSSVRRPTVDKHSTGGVGDKVSLVAAPVVASCGAAAPKLSGHGLGHTGGTIDKLASIPGMRTHLAVAEMLSVLNDVGCVICETGPELAPADKKLYALRNATGTVDSFPLIASSIMSKKIAGGADSLVLDVKVGSGAFVPDVASARRLAETMVEIGLAESIKTVAFLTRMEAPLGNAVGNALEVKEALEALDGRGPSDLMEVVFALAREMLALAGVEGDPQQAVANGTARACFEAMVAAQGGDLGAGLPEADHTTTLDAARAGYVGSLDARKVGIAAHRLGAGRGHHSEEIDYSAGVVCLKKPGDPVEKDEPILELNACDESRFDEAASLLEQAISIAGEAPPSAPVVIERIAR